MTTMDGDYLDALGWQLVAIGDPAHLSALLDRPAARTEGEEQWT